MRYIYIGTASIQISDGYGSGPDDVTFSERNEAVISVQVQQGSGATVAFEKVRLGTVAELLAAVRQRQAQAMLAEAVAGESVETESERHTRMSQAVADRFARKEHLQCVGEPPLPAAELRVTGTRMVLQDHADGPGIVATDKKDTH